MGRIVMRIVSMCPYNRKSPKTDDRNKKNVVIISTTYRQKDRKKRKKIERYSIHSFTKRIKTSFIPSNSPSISEYYIQLKSIVYFCVLEKSAWNFCHFYHIERHRFLVKHCFCFAILYFISIDSIDFNFYSCLSVFSFSLFFPLLPISLY